MTSQTTGLFCEIRWGPELAEARSFSAEKQQIHMAPDERADLPAYGFELPDEGQVLAERTEDGRYRLHLPPGTTLFRVRKGAAPIRVPEAELGGTSERRTFLLDASDAVAAVVESKELWLHLVPSVVDRPVGRGSAQRLMSAIILIGGTLALPFAFLGSGVDPQEMAELQQRARAQEAARKAAERQAAEEAFPSHVDPAAEPVRPENGITLPGAVRRR